MESSSSTSAALKSTTSAISLMLKDPSFHSQLAWAIIVLAPVVFFILTVYSPCTYGKLAFATNSTRANWFGSASIPAKWAWMMFESPNWIWVIHGLKDNNYNNLSGSLPNAILLAWFFWHYIHRSFWYPLQMSSQSKFPIGLLFFTFPYTIVNGYLQAFALCHFQVFPTNHEQSFSFVFGVTLMISGFVLGYVSDQTLLRLKNIRTIDTPKNANTHKKSTRPPHHDYHIPTGGLFDYVSMPHYLGELLEWIGFSMACQCSLASLSFVIWTAANLIPRALAQHDWYHEKFREDYPKSRKAILPFLL